MKKIRVNFNVVYTLCAISVVAAFPGCGGKDAASETNQPENPAQKVAGSLRGTVWNGPYDSDGKLGTTAIQIRFHASEDSFSFKDNEKGRGIYLGPSDGPFKIKEEGGEHQLMTTREEAIISMNGQKINRPMAIVTYVDGEMTLRREVLTSFGKTEVRVEYYRKN